MTRRLFVALTFPDPVKEAFARIAARLRAEHEGGDFVPAANYHLTLRFLGETDDRRLPALDGALRQAASSAAPFVLRAGAPGSFARGEERTLWVGLTGDLAALSELRARLEDSLAAAGFGRDPRGFAPHVTIARRTRPKRMNAPAGVATDLSETRTAVPAIRADGISLMESTRRNGALVYVPLMTVPLGPLG